MNAERLSWAPWLIWKSYIPYQWCANGSRLLWTLPIIIPGSFGNGCCWITYLTLSTCLTFNTNTSDWGAQTHYCYTHAVHTKVLHTRAAKDVPVRERGTTVYRMMGCLFHGVMNSHAPSASLKDSCTALYRSRVDTHHTLKPVLPALAIILALRISWIEKCCHFI